MQLSVLSLSTPSDQRAIELLALLSLLFARSSSASSVTKSSTLSNSGPGFQCSCEYHLCTSSENVSNALQHLPDSHWCIRSFWCLPTHPMGRGQGRNGICSVLRLDR